MRRGLYRVHGTDGQPDDVRVEDDGIEIPVDEALYRARGYAPPVEDLPWQESYAIGKRYSDDSAGSDGSSERAARDEARKAFLSRFEKRK